MEPAEPSKSSPKVVEMGPATRPPQAHLSEHLANERTYLAYLRTSISLISFGITINRFSIYLVQSKLLPERHLPTWDLIGVSRIGFGMVIFGLGLLVWAALHSTHVSRAIDDGTLSAQPVECLDYHSSGAARRGSEPDLDFSALIVSGKRQVRRNFWSSFFRGSFSLALLGRKRFFCRCSHNSTLTPMCILTYSSR